MVLTRLPATILAIVILVSSLAAQDQVSTGPDLPGSSTTTSSYMRGIGSSAAAPSAVHIVGIQRKGNDVTVQAVLIDEYGNAMGALVDRGSWQTQVGCVDAALSTYTPHTVSEHAWQAGDAPSKVAVLIDNSVVSQNTARDVVRSIQDVLPTMSGSDLVSISTFDHHIHPLCTNVSLLEASELVVADSVSDPEGIPAVYSAMMHTMEEWGRDKSNNILILVTASNDLASLAYSTQDIVKQARGTGTRIYVVRIGMSPYGHVYRYLSTGTGGRLYTITPESVSVAGQIIREILYSAKHHVTITSTSPLPASCDEAVVRLSWTEEGGSSLTDTMVVDLRDHEYRTTTAVIAAFSDNTDRGLRSYNVILEDVAADLVANPNKRIRITGHVAQDITTNAVLRGRDRAENVAGFLTALGVATHQLEIESAGNSKPMYFLQMDGSQRLLNNRVEAMYLNPTDLPYTIAVEHVPSEEKAASRVQWWTKKGYKAYFEPVVIDGMPQCNVVLWGYATRTDAEKAGKGLKQHGVKEYTIR